MEIAIGMDVDGPLETTLERAAGLLLEPVVGCDENPPVPQAGSPIVKFSLTRGLGWIRRTMHSISGRGVKYWPAPFLPSAAVFSSSPSNAAALTSTSGSSTQSHRST